MRGNYLAAAISAAISAVGLAVLAYVAGIDWPFYPGLIAGVAVSGKLFAPDWITFWVVTIALFFLALFPLLAIAVRAFRQHRRQ